MENTVFTQLKRLYEFELYKDVLSVASLLHTMCENDRTTLTIDQECQLLLFEANAYYYERRFRCAEARYRMALQSKQHIMSQKHKNTFNSTNLDAINELFPDIEIKYRLAVCLHEIQDNYDAIKALQSIPHKQRSPKMNFLLARLQQLNSNQNGAVLAFKDVLRDCPMSLESMRSLLEMGTNGIEVNSLIVNVSSSPQCSDWLNSWIKGHDQLYSQKFTQAAETFKSINQTSRIRNNELLLVMIGESYYYNGNLDSALRFLTQAHRRRPEMLEGIQSLAVVLFHKNKVFELESLTPPALNFNEYTSENYFVVGQTLYAGAKYEKAAYFLQKAIYMNPRNVESYLMKARLFCQLKKHREALIFLRTVQNIAPYRFETLKGIVDCYLATNRRTDAQTLAAHAVRNIGQTPRTLVLLARTFPKEPMYRKKVKSYLTKALELEEYFYPAAFLLAELLQEECDNAGAIKVLRKQVATFPNVRLHTMLGDILSAERDMETALEHYTLALSMDPTNIHALTGLSAMGCSRNQNKQEESSYTTTSSANDEPNMDFQEHPFEMVEIPPTLSNAEPDSEAMWSENYDSDEDVNHN